MAEASLPLQPEAITLLFDGGPIHKRAGETTVNTLWHSDTLPELMEALCANAPTSRVRCNFDPGTPWDEAYITELVRQNPERRS